MLGLAPGSEDVYTDLTPCHFKEIGNEGLHFQILELRLIVTFYLTIQVHSMSSEVTLESAASRARVGF